MKISISEIFESIQGEGRNTGLPSVFVRLWGCNLKCTWCDSKYSWDITEGEGLMMTTEEIVAEIKSFKSTNIIFTGGEPTLFQKQIKSIQFLLGDDYTYELETNGSQEIVEDIVFEQINISPKLKSSGNKEYKLNILKSDNLWESDYIDLKFVCSNIIDTKETDNYINKISKSDGYNMIDDIYIMPLGRNDISQVNEYLVKYCISNLYRYCLRQHLILFGDGKGK